MSNERLNNYHKDLPPHYREDYCIDAKKASVSVLLTVAALLVTVIVGVAMYFARFGVSPIINDENDEIKFSVAVLVTLLVYCVYIVVHELTHGISYKLLTKQKLTFGLTLTVAFCGLKEGYVNKKTALISVLAPFVVHSIWMVLAIFLVRDPIISLMIVILFALHFGGCCGDLWVTFTLLFKYRGKEVLMCDNGPRQQFFIFDPEAPEFPQTDAKAEQNASVSLFGTGFAQPSEQKTEEEQNEDEPKA